MSSSNRNQEQQPKPLGEKLFEWYRSTFGYGLVGGILLWAAFPWADFPLLSRSLWPLAWIAPIWWVMLARREKLVGKRPWFELWVAGFAFWMATLHWLRLPHWATSFGWVAGSFYLAFYLPVFVGLTRVAVHRLKISVVIAAPVVWTGLELARAHFMTGFTMASLGHTQYRWIELIQISDLAGFYGVSFLVMLVAACLARMLPCGDQRYALWPAAPLVGALAMTLAYGFWRTNEKILADVPEQPGPKIALIQGSIDPEMKADPEMAEKIYYHYEDLSREATSQHDDLNLIVWPETMYRYLFITAEDDYRLSPEQEEDRELRIKSLGIVARRISLIPEPVAPRTTAEQDTVPWLLGIDVLGIVSEDEVHHYNSAVFVDHRGSLMGRYDKVHPVIFGEYVPFAKYFPWLYNLTPLSGGLTAGRRPVAFEVDGALVSPNICYESVLSHLIRGQINELSSEGREPDVLVNMTNDGWYWGSSELDLHLVCGVFRAVECRKPFLIAANTGISAHIDGNGRILRRGPRRKTAVIIAEVQLDNRYSWYLKHGDWPAGMCLAICFVLAAIGGYDRWRWIFVRCVVR